jgi:hypothetical protein
MNFDLEGSSLKMINYSTGQLALLYMCFLREELLPDSSAARYVLNQPTMFLKSSNEYKIDD